MKHTKIKTCPKCGEHWDVVSEEKTYCDCDDSECGVGCGFLPESCGMSIKVEVCGNCGYKAEL